MFFHLIMTGECNLQCKYCYGEAIKDIDTDFDDSNIDYDLPKAINYSIEDLKNFCLQDPECVLTFYGGEPVLCTEQIKEIMNTVPARQYMIQTNGLLLDLLESEYVNRLHTILVSIDGDENLTDYYRGKGTFRKIRTNLKQIMNNGFQGELVARMTVAEQTDIYKQATWLMNNSEFAFHSVHWQLNAGFWKDYERRNFKTWLQRNYNPGVKRLCNYWVDQIEKTGHIPRLYPFLGIAESLLNGEKTLLRCGAGWINYTIQTDGNIIPCPAMWGMKKHYVGNILDSSPTKLKQIHVNEPCSSCDILGICGGRCLYANLTKRWSQNQYHLVCDSVRNLINSVTENMPRITRLLNNGKLRKEDFSFIKYNGCEIIP
jgi:putative peptide-modifying radical SAM enzyme